MNETIHEETLAVAEMEDQVSIRRLFHMTDEELMAHVNEVFADHSNRLYSRKDWHFAMEQEFKRRYWTNALRGQAS